ncbi:endonuclease/exonuclease/phosphatase family protein [Streptomyces sp. KL116D]|uniref:endonuclease/exonuclease/phosphatase family protein n=1 Tax=Streptomyces sp. KL116D TaxID=3045152 RepID=UPI003556E860
MNPAGRPSWSRLRTGRIVLLSFLLTASTLLTAAPPASAALPTYRLWHWNIAGNTLHHGSVSDGLVDALVSSVRNRRADLVSLNEVCHGQYEAVRDRLRRAGWPADRGDFARFSPTLSARTGLCRGSEPYGIALFSKWPLGRATAYVLPSDGTAERRVLLCAPLAARPGVTFCTTHLTPRAAPRNGRSPNERQVAAVRARLDAFAAAHRSYLVAGDFNAQPHHRSLNQMYGTAVDSAVNGGNRGAHRELDDADRGHCAGHGERTFTGTASPGPCGTGVKLDLLFARAAQITGAHSADSLALPTSCAGLRHCSDHRALTGVVTLRAGR